MGEHRLTGNKLWKLRSKHGRDRIFGDPVVLLEEAYLFFDWCDRHPWEKYELVKYQGSAYEEAVSLGRPYSIDGLTVYLGVSPRYFATAKKELKEKIADGRANDNEVDLLETIEVIEAIVRTQNLEGAHVGLFSAHIATRQYGLAETINQNNTGESTVRVSVRDQKTADDLKELDDLL